MSFIPTVMSSEKWQNNSVYYKLCGQAENYLCTDQKRKIFGNNLGNDFNYLRV